MGFYSKSCKHQIEQIQDFQKKYQKINYKIVALFVEFRTLLFIDFLIESQME